MNEEPTLQEILESYGFEFDSNKEQQKILCPFHDDHKPSLSINLTKNLWQCFSCQKKGNQYAFVAYKEELDPKKNFPEVVKRAYALVGKEPPSKKRVKKEEKARVTTFHITLEGRGQVIYEQIYNGDHLFIRYEQHGKWDEDNPPPYTTQYVKHFEDEKIKYIPLRIQPIEKGHLHLPEEASEYESEKELIQRIESFIDKYLQIDPIYRSICTYFVLLSWVHDKFCEIPFLRFKGDIGTGKTRALKVVGGLCYRAANFGTLSSLPAMFRTIENFRISLALDEADFRMTHQWDELIKLLNSRMSTDNPVWKVSVDDFRPDTFDVYGPTLLASRKSFHDDALESRCLTIHMPLLKTVNKPYNLEYDFELEQKQLRNQLLLWRLQHHSSTEIKQEPLPDIMLRLNQIAIPLLSIVSSNKAKEHIKDFLKELDKKLRDGRSDNLEAQFVRIALQQFEMKNKERDKLNCKGDVYKILGYKEIHGLLTDAVKGKPISLTAMGRIVTDLGLEKDRYSGARMLADTRKNEELLRVLAERYGVAGEEKQCEVGDQVTYSDEMKKALDLVQSAFGQVEIVDHISK